MVVARSAAQGNNKRQIEEISSNQLKGLQVTNSITAFYHHQMSNFDTQLKADLLSIPSHTLPLVQQYNFLFQDPRPYLLKDLRIIKYI